MMPQTEFPFTLPFGYTDSAGQVYRDGTMRLATAYDIESLYAGDLAYLQDLYRRINNVGHNRLAVTCPQCEQAFEVEVGNVGE